MRPQAQTGVRRTFTGATLPEAILLMKQEMGDDALFVSKQRVRQGGVFGMGGREVWEVTGEILPDFMRRRDAERRSPGGEGKQENARQFVEAFVRLQRERMGRVAPSRADESPADLLTRTVVPGAGYRPTAYGRAATSRPAAMRDERFSREQIVPERRPDPFREATWSPEHRGLPAAGRAAVAPVAAGGNPELARLRSEIEEMRQMMATVLGHVQQAGGGSAAAASSGRTVRDIGVQDVNASGDALDATGAETFPEATVVEDALVADRASVAAPTSHAARRLPKPERTDEPVVSGAAGRGRPPAPPVALAAPGASGDSRPSGGAWALPEAFETWRRRLVEAGVEERLVGEILGRVAARTAVEEHDDMALIRSRLAKEIGAGLKIAVGPEPREDRPLVVVVIGATGVGKTTTLAKLGAIYGRAERRSIAFITLDDFRIAAAEQLRTYSELLQAPFEAVSTPEQLGAALDKFYDHEVILIDTTGRSPRDTPAIANLREMLQSMHLEPEVLLLVSASTQVPDMEAVLKSFSFAERLSLCFTKVDETLRWGPIYSLAVRSGIPVAYCTTGQDVPADIEPALRDTFVRALIGPPEERSDTRMAAERRGPGMAGDR